MADKHEPFNSIDLTPFLVGETSIEYDDRIPGLKDTTITITGTWDSKSPEATCALCLKPFPLSDGCGSLNHPALGRIAPVCLQCGADFT